MINDFINQFDLGEIKTPIGFYNTLRRLWRVTEEHCLPAIVREYDRKSHTAKVIPLPKKVFEDLNGEVLEDRATVNVKVLQMNHGKLSVDVPLEIGDTGYLFACDRRCDEAIEKNKFDAKDNEGPQRPDDFSISEFSAGFFLPCSWKENDKEIDGVVIKYDNDISFKITNDGIKIECEKAEKIDIVSDIRYDIKTHQLQKKMRSAKKFGSFMFDISDESEWVKIEGGQADLLEIE